MTASENPSTAVDRMRVALADAFSQELDLVKLCPVYDADAVLTHVRIPCLNVPEELSLSVQIRSKIAPASSDTAPASSSVHAVCDSTDSLASALREMLSAIHVQLEATALPSASTSTTERWLRYCLYRSNVASLDADVIAPHPQLRVVNDWKWVDFFRHWQVAFGAGGTARKLTIWLNSLLIPGRRGVCVTDADGRHGQIAYFRTAGQLIQCIHELCHVGQVAKSVATSVFGMKRHRVNKAKTGALPIKRNPLRGTRQRLNRI